ncbi:hypothetical protein SUGI_0025240 [Cryptomeria japonica]|nr:hypothetical protein SUGI_0025240 [Cryptomeria japonica]
MQEKAQYTGRRQKPKSYDYRFWRALDTTDNYDAFDGFEADVDENGCVPFDKPSSSRKVCKSKGSMSSVARVLYFDGCLDSGDEKHRLVSNGGTVCSLANKGLHDLSQALMWVEETPLKHQYKIPLAPSLEILNQENEAPTKTRSKLTIRGLLKHNCTATNNHYLKDVFFKTFLHYKNL